MSMYHDVGGEQALGQLDGGFRPSFRFGHHVKFRVAGQNGAQDA